MASGSHRRSDPSRCGSRRGLRGRRLCCSGLIATGVCVTATAVSGRLPLLAGLFINSLVGYGLYTVVHEAAHRSISGRNPTFARWDVICGNIAAQLDVLNCWAPCEPSPPPCPYEYRAHPGARRVRWLRSPSSGSSGTSCCCSLFASGRPAVNALMARLGATKASDGGDDSLLAPQRWAIRLGIGAILFRYRLALLFRLSCWVIPARLTFLYLAVFFVWLPHYPYEHTGFRNTRITPFSVRWLLLQQDRHLIHHLYPQSCIPVPGCASRTAWLSPNAARLWRARQANRSAGAAALKHLGDACGRQPWLRRSQALTTSVELVVLRTSSSVTEDVCQVAIGSEDIEEHDGAARPPHSMWTSALRL